ncbi:hypothetical protein BT96DRAFT_43313 [Gymnopus androsaceus JB14]|uniref:Uncharacterized protein n=1 Tax=Gymnopus androsaceus JB14 TaxID=1447944 RepID=A0A6A4HKT7_9AGAR|nr:hypothetical protein BT96DRAFT_43313 [Gymnopus androsaceus JB14]
MHFHFLAYLALSLVSITCAVPAPPVQVCVIYALAFFFNLPHYLPLPQPRPRGTPSKFTFRWDEELGEPWVRGDHKDWDPSPLALLLMKWVVNQEQVREKLGFTAPLRDTTEYHIENGKPFPYVEVLPNQRFRFSFQGGSWPASPCRPGPRRKWCWGSVGIEFPKDYSATSPAFYVAEVVHLEVSLRVPIPFDAQGLEKLEWQKLHEQIAYQHELYNRLVAIEQGKEPPKVNANTIH